MPHGGGEPCALQYGRLVKCTGNRWRVVFCTRPASASEPIFSIGGFFVEPKERLEGDSTGIKPGRTGAGAGYHAPFWTELHVHSSILLCQGPPI